MLPTVFRYIRQRLSPQRLLVFSLRLLVGCWAAWLPAVAYAQTAQGEPAIATSDGLLVPTAWYLLVTALALLVPTGLVLIGVTGLEGVHSWHAALGGIAAIALAALGYWATGFALQFGGVGLVYAQPALKQLVWEWSPLSTDWGMGWGMAGLSGWFLSGPEITPLTYTLFLGHLPWVVTAALLPVMAVRGRASAMATFLLPLLLGAFVFPLASNWAQGGGWLSALGRNLSLGHGLIDFGGAGVVFLVAAGFALAALVVWAPRRPRQNLEKMPLAPTYQPLLAVVGSLLVLTGAIGWPWVNPLYASAVSDLGLLRGSVNSLLCACGGVLAPLLYTWFVTGKSDPLLSSRGLVAGVVAGLASGPFVQPGVAFAIGLLAGITVPFVNFIVDGVLRLDDATGVVTSNGVPALIGLLLVGLFADGVVGNGWQMTGVNSYLGVTGQGVSGLFVARGYQVDFPGQLQAQVIGVLSLGLWGLLSGVVICAPLGLLFHGLRHSETWQQDTRPVPVNAQLQSLQEDSFDLAEFEDEFLPLPARESQERR